MRKIFYLIILLLVLVIGIELLRKFNVANIVVSKDSIEIDDKKSLIKSSSYGDFLTASVAQKTGDFDNAVKFFEKALEQDPDNTDILNKLYGIYLFKGDYEKAILQAKRNIELDKENNVKPDNLSPIPYLLVSLKNFKEGNSKDNFKVLKEITDPKVEDKSHLDAVVLPLILAWSYAINQDFKNAFKVIDNITVTYMLSVFSFNRAMINDLANNKPILIEGKDFPIEVKSKKFIAETFFELAQYSLQSKNLEEAVIYVRLARYLDPELYKLKKLLALIFESMNRLEEANAVYDEVEKSDPNYQESLFSKAINLHNLKKDDEALAILKNLNQDPKLTFQVAFAKGGIYLNSKDYKNAIKEYKIAEQEITKIVPEHWNLFFNIGIAYDKLGNWADAEAYLKKSVQLYPENPESLNYLAYSWLVKNKNIKQARAMLEAAVIKSGGAPHILDSYGWALYKLGFYVEALPFLEQASLALPYNSVINSHLGDLYWKLGRRKEALYQWKKAKDFYDKENSDEIVLEDINSKISSATEKN
ncbi:MAG: tetratricopeptide repeat protein [Rickettsiales bacterium]|nr:tetratricopeptide repeat protein [Rickettsiales bacterium]